MGTGFLLGGHFVPPPPPLPTGAPKKPALDRVNNSLRPSGGVNHTDSVLAKVGKIPAKKAFRGLDGSILSNSTKF